MNSSDRIKEIHRALKILDGQDPKDPNFDGISFFEKAIIDYIISLNNKHKP